mmetsp:Transcript_73435/g.172543  ORF Transcript_73435/g.172543 Transcript_73435/m.172543 type:complete len:218 (+) Transcript_73435:351-1004(+)
MAAKEAPTHHRREIPRKVLFETDYYDATQPPKLVSLSPEVSQAVITASKDPDNFDEYRRFLTMCKEFPGKPLVPCQAVDKIWHAHLDLPSYSEDCLASVGHVVGHRPASEDEKDAVPFLDQYVATLQLVARWFCESPRSVPRCWGLVVGPEAEMDEFHTEKSITFEGFFGESACLDDKSVGDCSVSEYMHQYPVDYSHKGESMQAETGDDLVKAAGR